MSRRLRIVDRFGALLGALFSKDSVVWLGVLALGIATYSGWLETPLQGVIRGYAYRLSGQMLPSAGMTNTPRVLSYALPCGLAIVLTIVARRWQRLGWLQPHAGAAVLVATLGFATTIVFRSQALLEHLAAQAQERTAIREFAGLFRSYSYSAIAPALDLAGTQTLIDRAVTAFQLIGYGWWFAIVGSCLLLVTAPPPRHRRLAMLAGVLWAAVAVMAGSLTAAPAIRAEVARLRGDALYAAGHYPEALARYRASLRQSPAQRLNPAFQERLGATLVWMGDRASPEARLFLARNLRAHGEQERAEHELILALAADPQAWLVRRRLGELHADLGLLEFKRLELKHRGARWERALAIDPALLRVRYYLAHAYQRADGPDQARALGQIAELLEQVRYPVTVSDLYALMGDSYFKTRQDALARTAYRRALRVVPLVGHMNLQAQRGLLGL